MDNDSPARTGEPLALQSNDLLGPMPTSAEDEAVVLARLSKTPAEAYERGYMDGAARERDRCLEICERHYSIEFIAQDIAAEIRGPNANLTGRQRVRPGSSDDCTD